MNESNQNDLIESEARFRGLFEHAMVGVALHQIVTDATGQPVDYVFLQVNPAFETQSGLKREGIEGKRMTEVMGVEKAPFIDVYGQVAATGVPVRFEQFVPELDRHFDISAFSPKRGQFATVFIDISDRNKMEHDLRDSVQQKTALLNEVHHRVKNNLQVMSSLLNLQALKAKNPEAVAALKDAQGRLKSMALLHQRLYHSTNASQVQLEDYVKFLCRELSAAYGGPARAIEVRHQIAPVPVSLDQAVPCGLIINELVVNSFKHAFPNDRRGVISVEFSVAQDGWATLRVFDNGTGLPQNLDLIKLDSLGILLVQNLARQLRGSLEIRQEEGAHFEVRFPLQPASLGVEKR